jgi:hypothetical protein
MTMTMTRTITITIAKTMTLTMTMAGCIMQLKIIKENYYSNVYFKGFTYKKIKKNLILILPFV